jgi:hypothetical protein
MSMMKINFVLILAIIFFGCSSLSGQHDSLLDKNWGRSFETAKYNQIIDHEAGKKPVPITGLDGTASENNREKYLQGFTEEAAPAIYNLNISNVTGR